MLPSKKLFTSAEAEFAADEHQVPHGSVGDAMLLKQAYTLLDELLQGTDVPPQLAGGLRAVSSLLHAQCSLTRSAQELLHRSDTGIFKSRKTSSFRRPMRTMSKKETKAELLDEADCSDDDVPVVAANYSKNNLLHRAMLLRIRRNMNLGTWTTTTTATGLPCLESAPNTNRSSNLIARQWARGGADHCRALRNLISCRKQSIDVRGCSPMTCDPSPSSPDVGSCLSRKSSCQSVNRLSVSSAANSESGPTSPIGHTSTGSTPSASLLTIPHSNNGSLCNVAQSNTPSPTESPRQRSVSIIAKGSVSPTMSGCHVRHASQSAATRPQHMRKGFSPKRVTELSGQRRLTPESSDSDSHPLSPVVAFSIKDIHHHALLSNSELKKWDYPLFDAARELGDFLLSKLALKIFHDVGLLQCFKVPVDRFICYFHAIECSYGDNAYHNKMHAADVLHGCAYLTTQAVPGLKITSCDAPSRLNPSPSPTEARATDSSSPTNRQGFCNFKVDPASLPDAGGTPTGANEPSNSSPGFGGTLQPAHCVTQEPFQLRNPHHKVNSDAYGVIGSNLIALELLALYTAAALHDYDHPGRTNAHLVATQHPLAILYNDRAVLENHHAAHAWELLISRKEYNWLCDLDAAELKRFRFMFIELILATDLKRHFEFLTEWTSKFCPEDGESGIDWQSETDRLLVLQMLIKLADLNGPTKAKDIHLNWVTRLTDEFYMQGDEEAKKGLPISPYMNRKDPQLAKLQVTFINHIVSPLCSALYCSQLLPGYWSAHKHRAASSSSETDDSAVPADSPDAPKKPAKQVACIIMQNLRSNQAMWTELAADEEKWSLSSANTDSTTTTEQHEQTSTSSQKATSLLQSVSNASNAQTMRERSKTISMPSGGHSKLALGLRGWRAPKTAAETSCAETQIATANLQILALKSGAMYKFLLAQQLEKQSHRHHKRQRQHRSTLGGALPFTHKLKSHGDTPDTDEVKVTTLLVPCTVNTKQNDSLDSPSLRSAKPTDL